jgi:hypothetical protein
MKSVSKALSTGDLFFSSSSLAIPCLLQSLTRKGVRCEIRKGDKSAPGARISALSPFKPQEGDGNPTSECPPVKFKSSWVSGPPIRS